MKAPKRKSDSPVDLNLSFVENFTLAFVILKLTGYIDWSWWWVISPVWITYGSIILFAVILAAIPDPRERRRKKELERLCKLIKERRENDEGNTADTVCPVGNTNNSDDGSVDSGMDNL